MEPNKVFDPDATGVANGNYFGFEFSISQADLVLLSVPWDATVSYRAGTALGPEAIKEASTQVEIYDAQYGELWKRGIATDQAEPFATKYGVQVREKAAKIISQIEHGESGDSSILEEVNSACATLHEKIYRRATELLDSSKIVGLVGGDHSTPLGLVRALAQRHPGMGILHIDAHCDLREAYEGFTYSHASIMYNILKSTDIVQLTQVAVRDFCSEELALVNKDNRVTQFTDLQLNQAKFSGRSWSEQCAQIINTLPKKVYISLDIDGLDPSLCPSTGTPVAGGLSWNETIYLLHKIKESGRTVVGFDLNEVSPSDDQWDANVGARILYKLCLLALS